MKTESLKFKVFSVIFVVVLCLATLMGAEIICRVNYNKITTPTGRWAVGMALSETFLRYDGVDPKIDRPRFLPHPYLFFEMTPNYKDAWGTQHNSMGYRQAEFDPIKKKGTIRILTLGGSTTYGAGVLRYQETWPSQLQEMLSNEHSKQAYEVINGGVDSYASPEILMGWIFRWRYLHPDIVILNMGVNDVWPVLQTKLYSPEYIYFRRANVLNMPGPLLHHWLKISYLVRAVYASIYNAPEEGVLPFRQNQDPDIYEMEKKNQAVTARVKNTDNIGFKRNFDELIHLIKMDGAKIFVTMEPSLAEEQIPEKVRRNGQAFILGLQHAWKLGLAINYDSMMKIATKNQVPYLLIDPAPYKFDWYSDWYHLTAEGEHQKALDIKAGLFQSHLLKK